MTSRADRRRRPKRELRRRALRDLEQILELQDKGIAPQAIASSLGLSEEFIKLALETLETTKKEARNADIA